MIEPHQQDSLDQQEDTSKSFKRCYDTNLHLFFSFFRVDSLSIFASTYFGKKVDTFYDDSATAPAGGSIIITGCKPWTIYT